MYIGVPFAGATSRRREACVPMILAELSLEGVVERLISSLFAGAVVGAITLMVLRREVAIIARRVEMLERRGRDDATAIAAGREGRIACELRAAHEFASRGEIVRQTVDAAAAEQTILARLDQMDRGQTGRIEQLHGRVTDVAGKMEHVRGRMVALERAANGDKRPNSPQA